MKKEGRNMKKKLIPLILLLLTISIGVTYAIFKWTSSNSDVTFEVEGCYITYDAGSNISGASFGPALSKDDTTNVISKKISMTPECSGVTANLTLKVDSIDDGLKEQSFIYELYDGTTKIANGNFADATADKVYSLLNTKTLTKDITQNYTLYIYIDGNQDNPTTMGGQSFSFTLGASGENALYKEPPVNAVTLVESLDDGTTGDDGSGVYKVSHEAIASDSSATGSEIKASTDYRYYGDSPNNYLCLDIEGGSTCPDRSLYRIIGSIYEEKENTNRIKVIKATPLTNGSETTYPWDSGNYNIWATPTDGNYSNSLTSGASLMKLLNSGDWWCGTNTYANYGLTETAKSMVNTSRYYLGGVWYSDIPTSKMYERERQTGRTYDIRPLYWDGYVGLMYPSDYGYASGNSCATNTNLGSYNSSCKSKDWLYYNVNYKDYWLMSPVTDVVNSAWSIDYTGYVDCDYDVIVTRYLLVFPVFYLTSDVVITEGTGTSTDPYLVTK